MRTLRTAPLVLAVLLATGRAEAQEPRLYFEQDGEGQPLVFVADWAHDTGSWFRLLPLVRDGRRMIRYDPRGQGRSEAPPDGNLSLDAHVRDLDRLVTGLGLERVDLLGVGTGGIIALEFARREPGRVRSVTAVSPRVGWSPSELEFWNRFLGAYSRVGRPTLGEYSSVLMELWFGTMVVTRETWLEPFYDLMLRRQSAEALVASLAAWLSAEPRLGTSQVLVPVLVVRGERDHGGERDGEIRAAFPWFQRIRLTGAGAQPQVDAPGALAAELERFLDVAEAAAGSR